MALRTLLFDEEHRDALAPSAPTLDMFRSLGGAAPARGGPAPARGGSGTIRSRDEAAGKGRPGGAVEAEGRIRAEVEEEAGRQDMLDAAFRCLFHAQVAQWAGDEAVGPLPATEGLRTLLTEHYEPCYGLGRLLDAGRPLFDGGRLRGDVLRAFEHSRMRGGGSGGEAWARRLPDICRRYRDVYDTWQDFARGEEVDAGDFLEGMWFLAGLDRFFRTDGLPEELPSYVERPTRSEIEALRRLWQGLGPWQSLFALTGRREYRPAFGPASQLIAGAHCDLYFDRTLLLATLADEDELEQEAFALAGYYVLSAMGDRPWPVERLLLYTARDGRMLCLDVPRLQRLRDMKSLAHALLEVAERRFCDVWAARGEDPAPSCQQNIARHFGGDSAVVR